MKVSDQLNGPNGPSTVMACRSVKYPQGINVFNFRVNESHTYFVRAEGSQAEPVWVHNAMYNAQGEAQVELSLEEGMSPLQARPKAMALQSLSDQGLLSKAVEPVARDPAITRAFRQDMIDRIWAQYGQRNPEFAVSLIDRVTTQMSPDHIWELQLGGPDITTNLSWLDRATNEAFGRQIRQQLVGVPTGTQVRINLRGF